MSYYQNQVLKNVKNRFAIKNLATFKHILFMKNYLTLLLSFLFFGEVQSQFQWESKKEAIIIPFELIHNTMIVDMKFNGTSLKMIMDTGASKNLIFSIPENDSLVINEADRITVSGVGTNEAIEGYLSKNNKLKIKEYTTDDFEAIFVTNHDMSIVNKLGIPVNGIIGNTFFKNHLVEIDYERNKIIIYKNKDKQLKKIKRKYDNLNIEIIGNKPYVFLQTKIENKNYKLKLLFDTGLGDGLWLFENDTIQCNSNYFNDFLGRGFGGDIDGKKSRVSEVIIENNILKNALVAYPEKIFFEQKRTFKDRNGSLGGEIIKRFNWFLDYENQMFYFKKNNLFDLPFEYNMAGIEVQHAGSQWTKDVNSAYYTNSAINRQEFLFDISNIKLNYQYELKPIFDIYAVRENSPAAKAGLKIGDRIIKINNKEAHQLTVESITKIFQSEDKKSIKIIIERNGKQMSFDFQLEKIL